MHHIGLDLGGTDIKGGLTTPERPEPIARHTIPTEADRGPDHVIDRLAQLARQLAERADLPWDRIESIGVGTPGPIEDGVVLQAPNLYGWTNVPLLEALRDRTGKAVTIVNDANAAAFGEYHAGAAANPDITHMVLLTLGTGIGGGAVLHRQLYVGGHGAGAELGHTIIVAGGRQCPCGQHGCIEAYASATAIARDAAARLAESAGDRSILPPEPSAKDVFDAAAAGDSIALEVVDEAARCLGIACVNLTRAFDPQMIVLGGGMMAAGDLLLSRVEQAFHHHTWRVRPERLTIAPATLGNSAGFIGAAALAAQNYPSL